MAYYLTVDKGRVNGKEEYEKINITKANCFTRLSKTFKGEGCSLQEIDVFTTQFIDETELREYLVSNGFLSSNFKNRKLSVRIKNKQELKKVLYDFLYQKDLEYLLDIDKLINMIKDRLWVEKDFRFIRQFANNYMTYRECNATAADIRFAAIDSINIGKISDYFHQRDENGDDLITRMIKLLVYEHFEKSDGKIVYYYDRIKYRNLHSIIAFINNYDKKYNDVEEEKTVLADSVTKVKPKDDIKRKTLSFKNDNKKYVLDGQTSLF